VLLLPPPHPATRRAAIAMHPATTAIRTLLKMVSRTSYSFHVPRAPVKADG